MASCMDLAFLVQSSQRELKEKGIGGIEKDHLIRVTDTELTNTRPWDSHPV